MSAQYETRQKCCERFQGECGRCAEHWLSAGATFRWLTGHQVIELAQDTCPDCGETQLIGARPLREERG